MFTIITLEIQPTNWELMMNQAGSEQPIAEIVLQEKLVQLIIQDNGPVYYQP